jgi:CheY-like chemotaxis protein
MPKPTILVVDDESSLREIIVRSLQTEGYRVIEAGDGQQALALLDQDELDIALVITDIRMPRMDGYELAERITVRPSPLPIIFISGYDQGGISLPGSIFAKPFSMDALLQEMRRLLGPPPSRN